uniref:Uncharacterized protein n=1 Tax=Cucumis melo TaxID=3656 RepID=A0A9I9EEN3_CUCME
MHVVASSVALFFASPLPFTAPLRPAIIDKLLRSWVVGFSLAQTERSSNRAARPEPLTRKPIPALTSHRAIPISTGSPVQYDIDIDMIMSDSKGPVVLGVPLGSSKSRYVPAGSQITRVRKRASLGAKVEVRAEALQEILPLSMTNMPTSLKHMQTVDYDRRLRWTNDDEIKITVGNSFKTKTTSLPPTPSIDLCFFFPILIQSAANRCKSPLAAVVRVPSFFLLSPILLRPPFDEDHFKKIRSTNQKNC